MARNGVASRMRKTDAEFEELHVLAVDDSVTDRKVIERLLKISSCKVTAVDSGRRALQFLGLNEDKNKTAACDFHSLKVDLIITDYCMPGMTGYELLKKIKESSALREIPVVIMSSENILARIDRCLEEGAKDFIMKPVKLSDVKRLKDDTMTTRDVTIENQDTGLNKRKSLEPADFIASTPSPQSIVLSSPLPSPLPPLSSLSDSSFNASLDSPTRRLKMTSCI